MRFIQFKSGTLILLLLLFGATFRAQTNANTDSIVNLIATSGEERAFQLHLDASKEFAKIGNYEQTFNHSFEAKNYAEKSNDNTLEAKAYYGIGLAYYRWDNSTESIKFLNKALLIPYGLDDAERLNCYMVIGINNSVHDGNAEAIEYYRMALPLISSATDISGRDYNFIYNNLALSFMEIGDLDSSHFYHEKCLTHRSETNNMGGLGQSYNNIGSLDYYEGKFDSALVHFQTGLTYRLKADPQRWSAIFESKINVGKALLALNQFKAAEEILTSSYDSAFSRNNFSLEIRASEQLKLLYTKTEDYKKAFMYNTVFHDIKDSMYGIGQKEEIIRLNHVNKYEEKLLQDSLYREESKRLMAIKTAQTERTNSIVLFFLIGVVLFLIGIVLLIYRNLRAKKKSEKIILQQKAEVDKQRKIALNQKDILAERNKEITDSIEYAERIQKAILPSKTVFNEFIKDGFVYYKPKDIVAGDFYWLESVGEYSFLAVADCTGHGVPGALVSVVCNNALNRTTREFGLREPAAILDKTRELVIETFEKSEEEVKDGMDISLCAFKNGKLIQWAGANNPIWIIRKEESEIEEIKADKQPIGAHAVHNDFTNHIVNLNEGDTVYLFTDGFQDQFGGDKGKKFKTGNLKKLILSLQGKTMLEQQSVLDTTLETWSGEIEQVDDVCIIGFRS